MKVIYSLFSIFLLIGCPTLQEENSNSFAEVNGRILTLEEAKEAIPNTEFIADSISALQSYRDDWIRNQLVLEEINRLNLADAPEVKLQLQRNREQTLLIAFQEAILSSVENNVEVSIDEAQNYYQQNKEKFLLDERYIKFRHMIASSSTNALRAKQALMQGTDWNEVANRYSINADLVLANSARFWPSSSALKEYDVLNRYLQVIGINEISIIENIGGNYHFVQLLEEKAEGEHPDLEWLFVQIQEWLTLEKKRVAYNTYVKNLYLAAQANNEIRTYNVLPERTSSEIISDTLNSN